MANVKLKSLKFPDLSDTYVVPSTAGDLTYSEDGLYSDGTVGKALQNTTASLEDYAKVDGSYDSMTVGNAEQLVSNVRVNDKTPYIFRTSGGSVDIGDREYINGIVGGTVAWNQYAKKINSENWVAESGVTATFGDGIVEFTSETLNNGVKNATATGTSSVTGHKYLVMMDAKISDGTEASAITLIGSGQAAFSCSFRLTETMSSHGKIVTANKDNSIILYVFDSESRTLNKTVTLKNIAVYDLTQMFGSTIADYIYSLEQATAGAGVAWFKNLFPKPYYPYNTGELMHVSGLVSHDTTGFNQWDEEWEIGDINLDTGQNEAGVTRWRTKNYISIIPNSAYYVGEGSASHAIRARFYDADKNYVGSTANNINVYSNVVFTTPSNAYYMRFSPNISDIPTGTKVNVNLSWDGSRNGEYEPYELHSYPLDSDLTLRGIPKLDANNNLYYDGDVYEPNGTVTRKFGFYTLQESEISITPDNYENVIYANVNRRDTVALSSLYKMAVHSKFGVGEIIYPFDTATAIGELVVNAVSNGWWFGFAKGTTEAQMKSALAGTVLVYELATPTTETADPYQSPQIVDDFGTEEYVLDNSIVPVGHNTQYPVNLVAKLEMAPNSPSGDGTYVVKQTNGQNEYVPLIIPSGIPSVPTTDGTYKLTATVSNGNVTLTWEA